MPRFEVKAQIGTGETGSIQLSVGSSNSVLIFLNANSSILQLNSSV